MVRRSQRRGGRHGKRGLRTRYEYDSSAGNADERAANVYQLCLDPAQWFGFSVTLMRRTV
jgi:hypothetical protein